MNTEDIDKYLQGLKEELKASANGAERDAVLVKLDLILSRVLVIESLDRETIGTIAPFAGVLEFRETIWENLLRVGAEAGRTNNIPVQSNLCVGLLELLIEGETDLYWVEKLAGTFANPDTDWMILSAYDNYPARMHADLDLWVVCRTVARFKQQ